MTWKPITTGNHGLVVIGSGDGPAPEEIVTLACEILNACGDALALASVWKERARQRGKGYNAAHDDRHEPGVLTDAACAFLCMAQGAPQSAEAVWPFVESFCIGSDRRENLVKAAAMIVAEIERTDRMEGRG